MQKLTSSGLVEFRWGVSGGHPPTSQPPGIAVVDVARPIDGDVMPACCVACQDEFDVPPRREDVAMTERIEPCFDSGI